MKGQLNTIKLDIANYRHYWRGQSKIGKTTLFRDIIIESYGSPKFGLLLSMGAEVGYKSLDTIMVQDNPEWYDFVDTVDDLVENKKDNEYKILGIDTVDELVEMAERRVLEIHRATKGESASSLNAALGGFGAGKKKARSLIEEQIAKLERAGYGMIYIGHTKVKDITEKSTDVAYQQLTGSLEFAYDAIFADRADIMAMIVTESTAKDDRLNKSERYIYLRGTSFIDAGSRMENLPEKIVLGAKEYIAAINDALEKTSGKTGSEAKTIRKQEEKVREQEGNSFAEKETKEHYGDTKDIQAYKDTMLELAKSFSADAKALKKAELDRLNLPINFKDIDDMEILKKIYGILSRKN